MFPELLKEVLSSPALLKEIYSDLAKPGVKEVGKAIEGVLGLGNTVLYPLHLINGCADSALQKNLERFREKVTEIPSEYIVPVAPEIGVPILERIAYVSDEKLSEMYLNLLTKASSKYTQDLAHPSFINKLNEMTPDEASFLKKFNLNKTFHGCNFLFRGDIPHKPWSDAEYLYSFSFDIMKGLVYPLKLKIYLNSLESLGIVKINSFPLAKESDIVNYGLEYEELKTYLNEILPDYGYINGNLFKGEAFSVSITEIGKAFMEACIPK